MPGLETTSILFSVKSNTRDHLCHFSRYVRNSNDDVLCLG